MFIGRSFSISFRERYRSFLLVFSIGLVARLLVLAVLPLDWNWDSYHHWQISYLTLKIGLSQGRMWDLNGSEYYWGLVPHLLHGFLLWVFSTASMVPYRVFNTILGCLNAYLIYLIGMKYSGRRAGLYAGVLFAVFPIAVIYDTIAMQETLALFFALLSLRFLADRPVLSGIFLALAAQSRIEFWLISALFIIGVVVIERASRRIIPFVLSWFTVTAIFCWFFATRTSNPVYPLYWSLYNTFGGWAEGGKGAPFIELVTRWITTKLQAWPFKPTGVFLLASVGVSIGVFVHMTVRRWRKYQLPLFFMSCLVVLGPIFVPYFALRQDHLLLMLRMSIPIAALGSIILARPLSAIRLPRMRFSSYKLHLEKILIIVTIVSYLYFMPAYGQFQRIPREVFEAADQGVAYYNGGTVVCDYPILNYRLVSRWSVDALDLLSNHYSPAYYGFSDPMEFVRWFERHNVSMWIHANEQADTVWTIMSTNYPELLTLKYSRDEIRFYVVNQTCLKQILGG